MRKACEGCIWCGNCDGKSRCEFYSPSDETEEVMTMERREDRRNFDRDWMRYILRDCDVDWCEQPVDFDGSELSKTKGGD